MRCGRADRAYGPGRLLGDLILLTRGIVEVVGIRNAVRVDDDGPVPALPVLLKRLEDLRRLSAFTSSSLC
jgi:hypothetical protein